MSREERRGEEGERGKKSGGRGEREIDREREGGKEEEKRKMER